jgi:hypothetical protein
MQRTRQPQLTPERALLTATPSRSFFPRGFYWDEGFHLLLIGLIDPQMRSLPLLFCDAAHVCYSLQILHSWVSLIDQDGWVGREQILGDEARSKVRLPLIEVPTDTLGRSRASSGSSTHLTRIRQPFRLLSRTF